MSGWCAAPCGGVASWMPSWHPRSSLPAGSWGAGAGWDGENALICLGNGDTRNTPMEVIEAKYPLQVLRYALGL